MSPDSDWHRLSDEKLLDLPFYKLRLRIKGTVLEHRVESLYAELDARGIRFKPHVWLSEEWFAPDGVPGFAIPFYLAHPRLMQLERRQMLEVEGGTDTECMRIMRHEAGHALDTAYRLHFRRRWRELFGSFARPYPQSYKPKPNSRSYVLHLKAWYAQAHPAEDYAETFAVWLTPRSAWRVKYHGWPAMRKLAYIDELMREVSKSPAQNKLRAKVDPLSTLYRTLREHYRRKRQHYAFEWPAYYDRDLLRIFSPDPRYMSRPTAAVFLRGIRSELCHMVAEGTGVHHYAINHLLELMIERCKELKLRLSTRENLARQNLMIMLTVQTMNVVYSGYHRIAV
ncbi:MAG TPA: hypothetical protein VGK99_19160 [Acidobacteriota bacterium]|jgi:hypothetical protein